MRALRLGDRPPSASEEEYLLRWHRWGFGPEAAALACDKTILKCHEFKWPYCNAILRRWHEEGLHTVEQIEARDVRPGKAAGTAGKGPSGAAAPGAGNAWMRKYIERRDRED